MLDAQQENIEFKCPHCGRRLKAKVKAAGRELKCPKCTQVLRVPSEVKALSPPETRVSPSGLVDLDALDLGGQAIADLEERQRAAEDFQAKKEAERQRRLAVNRRRESEKDHVVAAPTAHSRREASEAAFQDSYELMEETPNASHTESKTELEKPTTRLTSFDDDLPDLAELDVEPVRKQPSLNHYLPADGLDNLDDLLPKLDDSKLGSEKVTPLYIEETFEDKYRVTCSTCGTHQYVSPSTAGMKIKCPDCLSKFAAPPPPKDWKPEPKRAKSAGYDPSDPLGAEELSKEVDEARRARTSQMLDKAERELSSEEQDSKYYDTDFDTLGFARRTFGFLADPIAIGFLLGYGFVFALVFGLVQFGVNGAAEGGNGRGAALLGLIGGPLIGIVFGLPMLSAALALLESVANRQDRVSEWPGFDMFENMGDLLAIAAALAGSILPGYLVGLWLGGEGEGAGRIQLTGAMVTTFAFFPLLLLSILDNGSLFQPLSSDVLKSMTRAAEAWGGYYLKTFVAFSLTMLIWYLMLGEGKSPMLGAAAGILLPLLLFFTFQQLGSLADAIGEHLSFGFAPETEEGTDDESEGDEN